MTKAGFTLVELSIVLVIIGLLIGGILIGQSLIESAKINKFVSQIQQFDIAVQQFKTKFNQIPGDANLFQYGGNNNGIIQDLFMSNDTVSRTTRFNGEVINFWPHLTIMGFKMEGLSEPLNVSAGGEIISINKGTQNIPKMALGQNTGAAPFAINSDVSAGNRPFGSGTIISPIDFKAGNFYFIADFTAMTDAATASFSSGGNATRNYKESIPVVSAMAIDKKMDDAHPRTGRVIDGGYMHTGVYNTSCITGHTANVYRVSASDGMCALMIRMSY